MTTLSDPYTGSRNLTWNSMEGGGLIPYSSNELRLGNGSGSDGTHYSECITTDLATDAHYAQDTYNYTTTSIEFAYAGPIVRCHQTNVDYYWCGIDGRDSIIFINKTTGGVSADGPSTSYSWADSTTKLIRLTASGTTTTHLSLTIDGVEELTWDDSSSPFFGANWRRVGHVGYCNAGTDTQHHYESFLGADSTAAADDTYRTRDPQLYRPRSYRNSPNYYRRRLLVDQSSPAVILADPNVKPNRQLQYLRRRNLSYFYQRHPVIDQSTPFVPPVTSGQLPIFPSAYSTQGSSAAVWPTNIQDTTDA